MNLVPSFLLPHTSFMPGSYSDIFVSGGTREAIQQCLRGDNPSLEAIRQAAGDVDERIIGGLTEAEMESKEIALKVLDCRKLRQISLAREWTLAHVAILRHKEAARKSLNEPALYRLRNNRGQCGGHYIARTHPELLSEICQQYPEGLFLEDDQGVSVADAAVKSNPEAVVSCVWHDNLTEYQQTQMVASLVAFSPQVFMKALQDSGWAKHLSDSMYAALLTHPNQQVRQTAIQALKTRQGPNSSPPHSPSR